MYISYQDFEAEPNKAKFIKNFLEWFTSTKDYLIAKDAETYARQENSFIYGFVRKIFTADGKPIKDPTSTIKPIPSNYFENFNTFRSAYSLGNGIEFGDKKIKQLLGKDVDDVFYSAGIKALEHKLCYIFLNNDHCETFKFTECAPMFDEETGIMRGCVRFWQIDPEKPRFAVLYEEDGYTKFKADPQGGDYKEYIPKRAYKTTVQTVKATGERTETSENYSALPIVPLYGTEKRQSTLVGMKPAIDSLDLLTSGFADDVEHCQQIFWVLSGCGGATDDDLAELRHNILYRKIVKAPSEEGSITAQTTPIPTDAHQVAIQITTKRLYDDYGMVDVHSLSASAKTATEIEAAYTPMDLKADDFEAQVKKCIKQLLALKGVEGDEAEPIFNRNRVVNETEYNSMILQSQSILGKKKTLEKLTFVQPEEIEEIMKDTDAEETERFKNMMKEGETDEDNTDSDDMPEK